VCHIKKLIDGSLHQMLNKCLFSALPKALEHPLSVRRETGTGRAFHVAGPQQWNPRRPMLVLLQQTGNNMNSTAWSTLLLVYGTKATRSTLLSFNKVDRVEFNFVASVYRA